MQCGYRLCTDKRIVKVPDWVSINTEFALRVPIAHELKPVLASVLDIIVLVSHVFQHLKVVKAAARIDGRDRAMLLAHLEP